MSEATTRAYAASAEALTLNMLAYAGDLLGLDPATETLAPHLTEPYRIELTTGMGAPFPLMTVSLKQWRRRGPGSTTEVMIRALGRLARTRVWRRHGTMAPPFGLLHANALAKAIVQHARVDPQAFFDATWSSVQMGEKYSDSADWMTTGVPPVLLTRATVAQHPQIEPPAGLPWLSGYSSFDAVFVEAWSLDERVVLHHRPQDNDRFEIRMPPGLPHTLVHALIGKPLRALVSHPVLDRFDIVIVGVTHHERSIRFQVRDEMLWRRDQFRGGSEARREVDRELRAMRTGRRHLEDLIARHLTIPGRKGDVDIPWNRDELFDDDEYDAFADKPWSERDEFEGIMSRRSRRDARHDDGDPIIRFDEDDPASYE